MHGFKSPSEALPLNPISSLRTQISAGLLLGACSYIDSISSPFVISLSILASPCIKQEIDKKIINAAGK